jgi:putative DNA primase/helicase
MINDPDFDGEIDSIRDHYEEIVHAIQTFATLGETFPTIGFATNHGWYQTRDTDDVDAIDAGYPERARCTTFERDWNEILQSQIGTDDRDRELYNITTWKEADAPYAWKHCTSAPDREWAGGDKPTPDYHEIRGIGFWFDLDLADKAGRSELTDDELETIEAVQQRVIETVADAYGVDDGDVYGLDSGGGAYIYGPPEVGLPIADRLNDPERGWFFDDLADRINDGPLRERIEAIINDADASDLLDPDWIQNVNRQAKAPGAIHHDHDLVVTPLRKRDPATGAVAGKARYQPTTVTEFSSVDVAQLKAWAEGLTRIEHTDAVGEFIKTLYPDLAADADSWEAIVDARVEELREQRENRSERAQKIKQHAEEWGDDEDGDTSRTGQYRGAEIVTDSDKVSAAISTIDVGDVVEEYAADEYDTSNRDHETTFEPSWRTSNSGKSRAIPNGENSFIDNGCDGGGDPLKAFALGEGIISGDRAAAKTLSGAQMSEAVAKMRAEGYEIPVYVPETGDDRDKTPLWALRNAALAMGVVNDHSDFVEHETDDGDTYLGFDAETYNQVLDELEARDISHGRHRIDDGVDPIKAAIARHNDEFDDPSEVPNDYLHDTTDGSETDAETDADGISDDADDPNWERVRDLYRAADEDSDVKKGPARQAAHRALEVETDWMCVTESDRLWVYDDDSGTFSEWGESRIGSILVRRLSEHYSKSEKAEIIDRVKESNRVHRSSINARHMDDPLVCVGNGVVNLRTGDLHAHSPSYRFVRGLGVSMPTGDNDLAADADRILSFLDDVTEREADRDTLLDHLGHGLMPGHPYRAFIVTYGPGGNGKTQVARLFRGFVGESNASSVEIDELVNDDFATSDLVGKFINWGDDMSGDGGGELKELSQLKKASGGSSIRSNEKYEKTFDFVNEAALFFSANEPPRIAEEKASVKDRLYPIRMPYRFVSDPDPNDPREKEKTPAIADDLLDDDAAMRGLLQLAVEHASALRDRRGEYSMPEGPNERFQSYNVEADPIMRFATMAFEQGTEGDRIAKDDAYHVYREVMDIWQERTTSADSFKRHLPRSVNAEVETSRSRALADGEDDRVQVWKRLRWSSDAAEFLPDWLQERYADHFEEIDH